MSVQEETESGGVKAGGPVPVQEETMDKELLIMRHRSAIKWSTSSVVEWCGTVTGGTLTITDQMTKYLSSLPWSRGF